MSENTLLEARKAKFHYVREHVSPYPERYARTHELCEAAKLPDGVQKQLLEAVHFEGSSEEKKIRTYLATLGNDYDALTKEEFVSLIGILKKSKHMKSPISQRGKTTMTHGKGKRKKR